MKLGRIVVALLAAALLTAGCGASTNKSDSSTVSAGSPSVTSANGAAVPDQLRFTAKTVDGKQFSGASLAGKPVVMWFWAPWCPICQGEAPGVAAAAHANPAVSFVGVAALDQLPAMPQFVSKYDLGFFPNIADVDGAVWQKFGVTAQPAYAFIAPDGSVDTVRGTLSESDLTARIRTLAASAS
jgi:thiol-disulfide isomerase/thioredoxin